MYELLFDGVVSRAVNGGLPKHKYIREAWEEGHRLIELRCTSGAVLWSLELCNNMERSDHDSASHPLGR